MQVTRDTVVKGHDSAAKAGPRPNALSSLEPIAPLAVRKVPISSKDTQKMSSNRIEGAAHKVAGSIKEAAGKITGNENLEIEGAAEKVAGDAQNTIGKVQDKLADELKK